MHETGESMLASPGSPAYQAATSAFNLAASVQPALATTARSVAAVRAALRHASTERLPVRVMSTGHAAAAVRPVVGGLLIRTAIAGEVELDTSRRVARIPAGSSWGDVVPVAASAGLAAPHGSSSTVGVVGYLLRGGLSCYGRELGLAVRSVRAVELVTADGELIRADSEHEPELFWALRGGGGGFGVVTAVELELFPAAGVFTGASFWPASHARRLLTGWLRWASEAPREATTSWRVLQLPEHPQVPTALSAGPVICVDGTVLDRDGDQEATRHRVRELLEPLREIAEPLLDTWQYTTPAGVLSAHMDPTEPVPVVGDHLLLGELDERAVDALLGILGPGSGSPLVVAGLRQLGGAYAVPDPAGGALDHLTADWSYAGSGAPVGPVTADALRAHSSRVREALADWNTGWTVPSFVESYQQPQRHLDPAAVRRLAAIRDRVDPTGLFRQDIASGASQRG